MFLEDIRCFRARQEVPVAPLTILVGENSTGKSTFLATVRILWDLLHARPDPDFNEAPFGLGAYENVASYRGGRGGRARSFRMGLSLSPDLRGRGAKYLVDPVTFEAEFGQAGSQPVVKSLQLKSGPLSATARLDTDAKKVEYRIGTGKTQFSMPSEWRYPERPVPDLSEMRFLLHRRPASQEHALGDLEEVEREALEAMFLQAYRGTGGRPYAIAPIRTRPERTYDPKKDTPAPEGGHIPMLLSRTFAGDPNSWHALKEALSKFGKACGLLEAVDVRRLGTKESDPFQIQVKVSGPAFNLVDVGYGVSQVLPILVDSLVGDEGQTFLMQQPEVHLHPRAQAELGTFVGELIKLQHKRFLIETHSDYLLERVRLDIRDGVGLKPEDVVILYFHRDGPEVKIHPITIDSSGNIVNAPKGYRQFFLEEERRFLGGFVDVRDH
jgi:hypothetical protein